MKIKTINNVTIKPIKHEKLDIPIKGSDLFQEAYCNVFICAKKKSGKSTVIYRILQKCTGKDTKVHIFASTVHRDPTYQKIIEYFDNHEIDYDTYTSLNEDGENVLQTIINELNTEQSSESDEETEPEPENVMMFGDTKLKVSKKKRKSKFLSPKHIFVFDDLGATLRDKSIDSLMKVHRHYLSKCIFSSQYLNDLSPQARLQLDYVLLFKGLPMMKLGEIYKDIDPPINAPKTKYWMFKTGLAFYLE